MIIKVLLNIQFPAGDDWWLLQLRDRVIHFQHVSSVALVLASDIESIAVYEHFLITLKLNLGHCSHRNPTFLDILSYDALQTYIPRHSQFGQILIQKMSPYGEIMKTLYNLVSKLSFKVVVSVKTVKEYHSIMPSMSKWQGSNLWYATRMKWHWCQLVYC